MFVCPEIERCGYSAEQLVGLYVNEKRIDTNATQIQGMSADGDSGVWQRFKHGHVKQDDIEPVWFAKQSAYSLFGRFPELRGDLTVAEAATRMQVAIDNRTGLSGDLYWRVRNVFEIDSPFWFTIYSPEGIAFMLPEASGADRGTIFRSDCLLRQDFDRSIGYYGSGADVEVYPGGNVLFPSTLAVLASMAVNKARASANYLTFAAVKVYQPGDFARSWDGRKFVILSGRKIDSTPTYAYTGVLESVDTVGAPTVLFGTGGSIPVGTIEAFGGTTAPIGWLFCDNTALLRAQYPELFAAIGTTFGSGDGSTTFNVPDARGVALRGHDSMGGSARGKDPGRILGSYQADEYKSHSHSQYVAANSGTSANRSDYNADGNFSIYTQGCNTGSSGGTETRMKNLCVNWIIKF